MKVQILKPTIVDVKYLKVIIPIPYFEDYIVNEKEIEAWDELPSCMKGGAFDTEEIEFTIDIDTGKILGWEEGTTFTSYAKVRDNGSYWIMDNNFQVIAPSRNRYVPSMLDTKGDGFGDYMQFSVNKYGYIEDFRVNFSDFPVTLLS